MYGVLLSYLGGLSGFTRLLDRVESTAKRLINCSVLSSSLDPRSLRGDVGALSLSYRYRSGKCSRELITRILPPLRRLRSIIGAVSAHEYCVDIGNSLSLIHISEPTRLLSISYAVFCLKKKKRKIHKRR